MRTPRRGWVCSRLLDAFRVHGPEALISKRRGKPSNRAHGAAFRQTCLAIVRERYEDFGPTLAAEKLAEVHGLPIGVEILRQWMINDGIWVRRRDRIKRVHQPRRRRDRPGCEQWWFEDRGPQCTLLVFVDRAPRPPAPLTHPLVTFLSGAQRDISIRR